MSICHFNNANFACFVTKCNRSVFILYNIDINLIIYFFSMSLNLNLKVCLSSL